MPNVLKTLMLASSALVLAAGTSLAQTSPPSPTSPSRTMSPDTSPGPTSPSGTLPGSATPGGNASAPRTTASLPADATSRGVVGIAVKGPDNKTVGKIDNVILSQDNRVHALVVDVGGVLGVGGKDVLVNPEDVRIDGRADVASTSLTEDQLKAKPEYRAPATR